MFVQHIVSNDAGVIWNDAGQWDMSELEGGTADSRLVKPIQTAAESPDKTSHS
jgi:hypothetical protein